MCVCVCVRVRACACVCVCTIFQHYNGTPIHDDICEYMSLYEFDLDSVIYS